ncbi:MAG: hypothetical protein H8E13_08940 [Actinobacteria bacterium]|nr:hypothetical protein [Actinomycetota bacterium]
MLQIINSKKKLNKLKFISDLILIEIPYKLNLHNCINKISLLYIYQISSQNEFIIIFNHSEINSTLKIKDLDFIFTSAHKKYVLDKKNFLYITSNIKNLIDIKLLYYLNTNKELSLSKYITSAHNFLNYKYPNYDKINTIIPVYKHYEFCSKVKNRILRILKSNSEHNEFYNNLMINNFYKIEKNGLYVDKKLFESKFGYSSRKYIDKNNLVYSNYNLLTTTGRPSNRFGGINYAALNKKDCTRKVFKSRFIKNGLLLEFDFESYHLRLIADLIGYTFPKNIPAHTYMAKKYFNIKNPNDEQIKESKSISFQMLYGNIDKKYKNIQFLKKTEQFIDNL